MPVPTAAQKAADAFDRRYLDQMVPLEQASLTMADIAVQRAKHEELRAMARDALVARMNDVAKLRGWATQLYGTDTTPPVEEALPEIARKVADLRTAEPFDAAYIDAMIACEEKMIALARPARLASLLPEISELADEILATRPARIKQLRELRALWYPEGTGAPRRP
jgi:uncharacterized protein (DUF305 family)